MLMIEEEFHNLDPLFDTVYRVTEAFIQWLHHVINQQITCHAAN